MEQRKILKGRENEKKIQEQKNEKEVSIEKCTGCKVQKIERSRE